MPDGRAISTGRRISATLAACIAFPILFILAALAVLAVFQMFYSVLHPNDPSTGDSAVWAMIFLAPLLIPALAAAAAFGSIAVYTLMIARSSTPSR